MDNMFVQEVVGKIYMTYDYSVFKFMKTNRGIDEIRKKKVRTSINKIGYISSAPIIVNKNMEIIDGQCRFTVCQELGLPIYFAYAEEAGIAECISMNISATSWKMLDYVRSYAEGGNENYAYLLKKIGEYPDIKPSVIAGICADLAQGADNALINSGHFRVEWNRIPEVESTIAFISEVMPTIKKMDGDTTRMCNALVFTYRHSSADNDRLRKVIGDMVLDAQVDQIGVSTMMHALKMIENAYNCHLSKPNRIRLINEYEDFQTGRFDWYEKKWGHRSKKEEEE